MSLAMCKKDLTIKQEAERQHGLTFRLITTLFWEPPAKDILSWAKQHHWINFLPSSTDNLLMWSLKSLMMTSEPKFIFSFIASLKGDASASWMGPVMSCREQGFLTGQSGFRRKESKDKSVGDCPISLFNYTF